MEVEGYKLDEVEGEGRTGRVYKAVRLADGQEVAFRQIKPHLAREPGVADRIKSLGKECAGIKHATFVKPEQSFTVQTALCVVEPWIEGRTLADRLLDGLLEPEEVVVLGQELLEALEELHDRGLIHGDVSPNNIFLTARGARLVGFGVADRAGRRRQGGSMFSDPYEAPEVRDGSLANPSADLYATAATLHRCLKGEQQWSRPMDEDDALADALLQGMTPSAPQRYADARSFRKALIFGLKDSEQAAQERVISDRRRAAQAEVVFTPKREMPAWVPKAVILAAGAALVVAGLAALISLLPDTPDGMAQIKAGSSSVGDHSGARDERPGFGWAHERFFLDLREVSVGEYRLCVEAGACTPVGSRLDGAWNGSDDLPIVGVTWLQADAYCAFVDKRLPSENEWEAAARSFGGRYPWGDELPGCSRARYGGDLDGACAGEDTARPVALPDLDDLEEPAHLAGNVWEFTASAWSPNRGASSGGVAPAGGSSTRVIKGGAWSSPPDELRTANRMGVPMDHWAADLGFRCASEPD